MDAAKGPPLSLRPFPVADKAPKNLAEFIARVNTQPGGFRAVTEEKLRAEIKSRDIPAAGDSDSDDVDMSDADNDGDQAKDAGLARMEVLKNIEIASNTAMLTLDSLSLLLSKQSPTQASLTLSQQLRDLVGIGTLGADRLDEAPMNASRAAEEETVAVGMTLMQINQARDAASEAGRFLQKEVDAENRYWEDVVAIKQAGWAICRAPNERHTLAVKFGFSEAAAEFKNNGLAPMKRGEGGAIELDLGRLGGISEGLVVTYEKDGQVTGRWTPRRRADAAPSLESRVLEARNTIFSQELWHELAREARTLAAHDVRRDASALTYHVDAASKLTLQLAPLAECPPAAALPDNGLAETVALALHLLLSYAHRCNELLRTRPLPPHISRHRGHQVYALLRPVVARAASLRTIRACAAFIGSLTAALRRAGLSSSFVLQTPPLPSSSSSSSSHSLLRTLLLHPIDHLIRLTILPTHSLTIRTRTFLFPVTTTLYHVLLPPSSPLKDLLPPFQDGYVRPEPLFDYIRTATSRLLTQRFLTPFPGMHFSVLDDPVSLVLSRTLPGGDVAASWAWGQGGESHTIEHVLELEQSSLEAT